MREFVARLIRAGMPRDVAVSACRQIIRAKGLGALSDYVDAVEGESDVGLLQP